MWKNDSDTTDNYHCCSGFRYHAHPISALPVVSGRTTYAKVYSVPGKVLPSAVFGMLVIYCLKDVSLISGSHGIPELLAVLAVTVLHLWKRQMLLSIAGGTIFYMVLLQIL